MLTKLKYVRCVKCFTTKIKTSDLGDEPTCQECHEPMEIIPHPHGKGNYRSIGFKTYEDYLESELWQRIRDYLTRKYTYRCTFCRDPTTELFHSGYNVDHLLSRDINSTIPVCKQCRRRIEWPDNTTRLSSVELQAAIAKLKPTKKDRHEQRMKLEAIRDAKKLANKLKHQNGRRQAK